MKLQFDTRDNEKQKLCARYWVDNSVTDIVYGGSKGSAKSYTGCALIFGSAFIYPETHWFISRKKLNDLRKFTVPSIHEVFNHWGIDAKYYSFNGQDNFFKLYNNAKVFLLDAKHMPSDPLYSRFGSMQMTGGWIEEAGEFESAAKQNLQASIGRWKNDVYGISGTLLQTCNPSKNYLYRDYYKKHKEGVLPGYQKFIQALPQDNKMLPDGYLENLNRILSKNEKERLLYGNWEYDDDPARLMDYENILHMFDKRAVEDGDMSITADIARFGSDRTVIGVWNGWVLCEVVSKDKTSVPDAYSLIENLRIKHNVRKVDVVIDEDGVGGGVVDMGGYKGFVNNSRPVPEGERLSERVANFQNLATQCSVRVSELIQGKGLWIRANISDTEKDMIIEECEAIKRKNIDSEGKISLVPKKEIKEKIGRSPDYWDMIKMRYFLELSPKQSLTFSI